MSCAYTSATEAAAAEAVCVFSDTFRRYMPKKRMPTDTGGTTPRVSTDVRRRRRKTGGVDQSQHRAPGENNRTAEINSVRFRGGFGGEGTCELPGCGQHVGKTKHGGGEGPQGLREVRRGRVFYDLGVFCQSVQQLSAAGNVEEGNFLEASAITVPPEVR